MPDPSRSTPTPETAEPVDLPTPGWSPPRQPPTSDLPGPSTTTSDQPPSPKPDGASDDERDEPSSIPTPPAGRSPAFSRKAAAAELLEPAAALIGTTTLLLNTLYRRRHPDTQQPQLWLATPQEAEAMAAPLASIGARHMPITGGQAGDIGDGIAFAGAASAFAINNLQAMAWERQPEGWQQQQEQDRGDDQPVT